MKNYRKALPEDVPCERCANMCAPLLERGCLRCRLTDQRYVSAGTCVGRKMTCDDAKARTVGMEGWKIR